MALTAVPRCRTEPIGTRALNPSTPALRPTPASLIERVLGALPDRQKVARQADIDAVRGIAIVLVVIGHVVSRDVPQGNDWYFVLKALIYRFHMPLFMTLAGISFALALPRFASWREVARYSRQKLARLAVPYLAFGLLILFGKLLAARFVHVDNPPAGSIADVLALVLRPNSSAAGFLWFIYVLGLYFIVLPAFLQLVGRRVIVLFLVSLAAQWVSWPDVLLLKEFFEYLPFFTGGMLLWICRDNWSPVPLGITLLSIAAFALALAFSLAMGLPKWLVGALSVPAFLSLAQRLPMAAQLGLGWVGRLSMSIYLMNTLAIGIAKAALLKVMPWEGLNFLLFFPVLAVAGVAAPIMVKQWAARRLPRVDRYL